MNLVDDTKEKVAEMERLVHELGEEEIEVAKKKQETASKLEELTNSKPKDDNSYHDDSIG